MHDQDELFSGAFGAEAGTGYRLTRAVRDAFRGKAVLEGFSHTFDLEEFAAAGLCEARRRDTPHPAVQAEWSRRSGVSESTRTGLFDVTWRGHDLEVIASQSACVQKTNKVAPQFIGEPFRAGWVNCDRCG